MRLIFCVPLLVALLPLAPAYAGETAATPQMPNAQATLKAMQACRLQPAALERLDCYDRLLVPVQAGFNGALVKARYQGEAWTRAVEQEKKRTDNTTALLVTQTRSDRPTVIVTTPALGHLPPRPVLMFSCVDTITRMQIALTQARGDSDVAVMLTADKAVFHSRWFVRENGMLLEASRGLPGIDEIRQLFGARTLTVETGLGSASEKLTFNIDGLVQAIAPLREACHWAGE